MNTNTQSIDRFLTFNSHRPVVLCIGTDLVIGDALGPIVGELLREKHNARCFVYGTLSAPVTAINLRRFVALIKRSHPSSQIIAVDSALGKSDEVGKVVYRQGPLCPGLATGKNLPKVGDFSIVATVGDISKPNALSSVRLGFIYRTAQSIALSIATAVQSHKGLPLPCNTMI